jgi:xylan 1,4-beta-xylosidase
MDNNSFECSDAAVSRPFPHFWEHTVGSGHSTMALRADWQKQLARATKELGFKHVRFHGLLSDDMSTLVDEQDKLIYSFFNADQICDFLLSIGMRPFMELSFMPRTLSSGPETVFSYEANITPPRDYDKWATLIKDLITHWIERYGMEEISQWFFEVWNEPNLDAFWKGKQSEYFMLYEYTANTIKAINNNLKVGGPATAGNNWISDFVNFCEKNKVPYDFISTHHYPTDDFGKPGDDTIAQLAASKRSALRGEAQKVKEQAGNKPVYYTEWCTSSNPFDELHDMPYAAAFIVKTVIEASGIVEGYSYWTFSDIFEENYFSSVPFHGGFGLMNIYGIPKPAYRAFELLHRLGDQILAVEGQHPTADVWVVTKGDSLNIMITNWALPRHEIKTETIEVKLDNFGSVKNASIERIDDDHANAHKAWKGMGSPETLMPDQVVALEKASSLVKESLALKNDGASIVVEITLPPQGIAYITIEFE